MHAPVERVGRKPDDVRNPQRLWPLLTPLCPLSSPLVPSLSAAGRTPLFFPLYCPTFHASLTKAHATIYSHFAPQPRGDFSSFCHNFGIIKIYGHLCALRPDRTRVLCTRQQVTGPRVSSYWISSRLPGFLVSKEDGDGGAIIGDRSEDVLEGIC